MQLCSNCGHQNRAGVVFCENCGASLIGKMPLDTKSLESSSEEEKVQIGIDVSVLTDVKVQGAAVFHEGDTLRLDIEGSPEPVKIKPKPETIFGRRDPATGAMPDVDLTPFAGYRMGVSRRHAAIRFGDDNNLDIWDLGSSNGTFLNGQRLSAHRPYRLRDGDELRLGQMMVHIYFEVAVKPAETPAPDLTAQPAEATPPAASTEPAASAPAAGESPAPQPPAATPEKLQSGSTVALQPSAIEEANVAPGLSTLPPPASKPVAAPSPAPDRAAEPVKPDSPAGQTNSAAVVKLQDEPKEAAVVSPAEAKPPDTPKAPENEEKRD